MLVNRGDGQRAGDRMLCGLDGSLSAMAPLLLAVGGALPARAGDRAKAFAVGIDSSNDK
jgi:hypothetical protein